MAKVKIKVANGRGSGTGRLLEKKVQVSGSGKTRPAGVPFCKASGRVSLSIKNKK